MENNFPADKGKYLGACNRAACLARPADWWNPNMRKYYCQPCGLSLNLNNYQMEYWKLCYKVHSEVV